MSDEQKPLEPNNEEMQVPAPPSEAPVDAQGAPPAAEAAPSALPPSPPTPPTPPAPASQPAPPMMPPPAAAPPSPPPMGFAGMPPRPPQGYAPPPMAPPQPGYGPPQQQAWGPPPQGPPPGYAPPPPGYGPPPNAGFRPPGFAPPQRQKRSMGVIVVMIFFFMVLFGGAIFVIGGALSGLDSSGAATTTGAGFLAFGEKVAILDVSGVLGEGTAYQADTAALIAQVKAWQENSSIKAIVVRVNSPGGAVSATQELYEALHEYSAETQNPVVTSMGDIAASGGYYTAMATDYVFANPGTLTGSIGVIMSFYDYQGIQDKIGISSRVVKSGEFKDIGSGSRAMTSEERALLQDTILDTYDQFLEAVVMNRERKIRTVLSETMTSGSITAEDVYDHAREVCDGRIFSGRQALEHGMIDELGTLDDAVRYAASKAGIAGEPTTIRGPVRRPTLFGTIQSKIEGIDKTLAGSARLEYRASFDQ